MQQGTRRGARHPSLVSLSVLRDLHAGEPSANHMEQIAMDMGALWLFTFPNVPAIADGLRTGGLVTKLRSGGLALHETFGDRAPSIALRSTSDTVRGWGAMAVGASPHLALKDRIRRIRPFADDDHFAVREWAWLSLRPHVIADPQEAVRLLRSWTLEESAHLRRFASEVTRPRGVWSAHIPAFKVAPEAALELLTELNQDPARYVQDSVGNWLNDASRTTPEWVEATCRAWLASSDSSATARICGRGMRTLWRISSG
jgi:3-methyladenine DNA glycosylase AlkC